VGRVTTAAVFSEADPALYHHAGQQALSGGANIRLFLTVEIKSPQLEAILNSTPDPSWSPTPRTAHSGESGGRACLWLTIRPRRTTRFRENDPGPAIKELLQCLFHERHSGEINMPDGKTYLAMALSDDSRRQTVGASVSCGM
jgi:hypothetical protein